MHLLSLHCVSAQQKQQPCALTLSLSASAAAPIHSHFLYCADLSPVAHARRKLAAYMHALTARTLSQRRLLSRKLVALPAAADGADIRPLAVATSNE